MIIYQKELMKYFITLAIILLSVSFGAQAQKFEAVPVDKNIAANINSHFSAFSLYRIDTKAIDKYVHGSSGNIPLSLNLPGFATWDLNLAAHDILDENYSVIVNTNRGKIALPKQECITYNGNLQSNAGSKVSLTITGSLFYGIIGNGSQTFFIEPLRYFDAAQDKDVYVVYNVNDAITDAAVTCAVTEVKQEQERLSGSAITSRAGVNCVQNQLAIASDASMFTRYGDAQSVADHNVGVINNVLWDYVNAQFTNNIELVIVTQNISTSEATDQSSPLYNGTNSGTILSNFRAWGEAGNFGVVYDDAELWTVRDIDTDGAGGGSGTVGLAYVGVICTSSRYHLLEDFPGRNTTGSGYQLRVLTSHEMGHNFGCSHDASGSPYIMAPTVQNTVTWSPASIASVDNHVGTRTCLAQCSDAGAPIADFIYSPGAICTGGQIQVTDHTLHGPTTWSWTFPGGTPATSTDRNPSVSFSTPGIKIISLTTTNAAGTSSNSKPLLVSAPPAAPACANTGTGTSNAGIYSFNLGSINKITGGLAADGNKYLDFSCTDNTKLIAGTTYTASVSVGTTSPSNEFNLVQFFIDYNNDGDFLDPGEDVHSSPSCYIFNYSFTFTTLANPPVLNQLLRVRVMAKDCVGGFNSCYNVTNGQVEDYAIYFGDGTILPLTLLNFEGSRQGGYNLLKWKTTAELNTDRFEVERSTNGTLFDKIGTVSASNTGGNHLYNFMDNLSGLALTARYYYRLKMLDRNGSFTYSNVVVLGSDPGLTKMKIFPNPVKRNENLLVDFGGTKVQNIQIFNSVGQMVYTEVVKGLTPSTTIKIRSDWSAGQYMIRILDKDNKSFTERLIIY